MPSSTPRVAYFPDSFHEVNGVAHTSRHFEGYARTRGFPFLCVCAGAGCALDPSETALELPRSFLSFALDKDLRYDPAFLRHLPRMAKAVEEFAPDLIHVTGPSELGVAGALLAHHYRVPLFASWHTNVHEYAATRSQWLLRRLPAGQRLRSAAAIERAALEAAARFYGLARLLFAPNPQLCQLLEQATGRPCRVMSRGVDSELFSPAHRTRSADDGMAVLGFVGRLSVEKNVQLLPRIHEELKALRAAPVRFLIIGQGAEEPSLRANLPGAQFAGVLRGLALAQAYANMDCFVFPSHTDTFGNVVLEAMASGVPAVVTPDGGPAHLVANGRTGAIVNDDSFADAVAAILADPSRHAAMREAARTYACNSTWDAVFDGVYQGYREGLGL